MEYSFRSSTSLSSSFRSSWSESPDSWDSWPPTSELEEIPSRRWLPDPLPSAPSPGPPAAASLVSLDRYGKLEGGVGPLLKLVKEGRVEEKESAAHAIGLLGPDPETVDQLLRAGVCSVFAEVLWESPMRVQAMVAWAVAELAGNSPKCQYLFSQAQHNLIRLLVSHLAFETLPEHSKYAVFPSNPGRMSIHSVVLANSSTAGGANQQQGQQHISPPGASLKGRELEDPETKASLKAMAARALWQLAKGNPGNCKSITESRALLCFAVLLEKAPDEVRYNSAMAVMEITRVAEKDADLRRSVFKPNSPAARAVVDQMLRVVDKAESDDDLLLPCVTAIGCLSRTFRATETRVIGPLVRLLDEREAHVSRAAVLALTKFASPENFLHFEHSRAIIAAGGPDHIVRLVYFGEQAVLQIEALVLLCYVARHVPDDEALGQAAALTVLEWASKQAFMVQDPAVRILLAESKRKLELYQSRTSRDLLKAGDGVSRRGGIAGE